jgi:hypothetical protein
VFLGDLGENIEEDFALREVGVVKGSNEVVVVVFNPVGSVSLA